MTRFSSTSTLTAQTASARFGIFAWTDASYSWNGNSRLQIDLLTFARLAEYQPVAMTPASMVGVLPAWIHDWTFADLHDTVAGGETDANGSIDQFHVSPLKAVAMHVIRDLAEQDAIPFENPIRFRDERR